jgi:hypothetical protein
MPTISNTIINPTRSLNREVKKLRRLEVELKF